MDLKEIRINCSLENIPMVGKHVYMITMLNKIEDFVQNEMEGLTLQK